MFMIKEGKVGFHRGDVGIQGERGPGEFFGEMALVENSPEKLTAIALTACEFYVLQKPDFDELLMHGWLTRVRRRPHARLQKRTDAGFAPR